MGRSDRFRQHKEGIYGGIAEEINAKRPENDKASTSGSTITSNVHQGPRSTDNSSLLAIISRPEE